MRSGGNEPALAYGRNPGNDAIFAAENRIKIAAI
jgi:hypothetical protein